MSRCGRVLFRLNPNVAAAGDLLSRLRNTNVGVPVVRCFGRYGTLAPRLDTEGGPHPTPKVRRARAFWEIFVPTRVDTPTGLRLGVFLSRLTGQKKVTYTIILTSGAGTTSAGTVSRAAPRLFFPRLV